MTKQEFQTQHDFSANDMHFLEETIRIFNGQIIAIRNKKDQQIYNQEINYKNKLNFCLQNKKYK
jgi:16S rRNA U1498 N3-methylase RsmE